MTVVMVMALAPSSFAQIELRLFNTPSALEIATDRHVRTADLNSVGAGLLVSGVLVANSTLTSTTLTLTFPAPITSGVAYPSAAEGIQIVGSTGVFASITTFASTSTTLTISLPGFDVAPGNNQSGSFRITGVRLDGSGLTGAGPFLLTGASLSSSSNNYIAPSGTLPTLITALGAGLGALSAGPSLTGTPSVTGAGTSAGTITVFTNQTGATPSDDNATITLAEGFATAWRTTTENSVNLVGTGVSGNGIRFTISGLPAGMTATITPAAGGVTMTPATLALVQTTAGSSGTFTFASTVSPALISTKSFSVVVTGAPTGTLTATTIGLVASMGPVAAAGSLAVAPFPKFTASDTASLTIGNVIIAKTTMLIPYAVSYGAGGSQYNTGIAISNTTMDPFTTGGATDSRGVISFYAYPRTSTGAFGGVPVTTSGTVLTTGHGLASDGALEAGGLFSSLLSEILATQTTFTGDFAGYVFIETNFLNAHGTAYLMTGSTISSGLPIMVLPPPAAQSRNVGGLALPTAILVEDLGF